MPASSLGPRWARAALLPVLAGLLALPGCAALRGTSVDETLAALRQTMGRDAFRASHAGWRIRGRTRTRVGEGRFEDLVDARGRFRRRIEGPLGGERGFDGRVTWQADAGGRVRRIGLDARQELLGDGWLPWGQWLDGLSGGPSIERDPRRSGTLELALPGSWAATVVLDPDTHLPQGWEARTAQGTLRVRTTDWRAPHGFLVPHRLELLGASGASTVLEVEAVERLDDPLALAVPPDVADGDPVVTFDPELSPDLPAPLGPAGHRFVQGTVDGQEAWFLVDSAAGNGLIDAALAQRAGWEVIGDVGVAGAGGVEPASWRWGGALSLGPLRRGPAAWVAVDLTELRRVLGVPVSGVLGYDLFSRAVFELDLRDGAARVLDPATWRPAGGVTLGVVFDGTAPCVRGAFDPGGDGWFRLDTGSDDTVAFHAPTVAREHWRQRDEDLVPVVVTGLAGPVRGTRARIPWFELAGERLERVPVTLLAPSTGALERGAIAGNLGVGLLRRFRIALDLGRERVVLWPNAEEVGVEEPLR